MGQFIDRTGQTVGRLTVLRQHPDRAKNGNVRWICRCSCGTERIIEGGSLKRTRSCGCLQIENATKHGRRRTPEYGCWAAMISRCTNPRDAGFKSYGGRGVSVCERWLKSFENFLDDVGERPAPGLSIDRVNNDGNYEPGNVRWATPLQQIHNRRRPKQKRVVHVKGMRFRTIADAAAHFGVSPSAVRFWINGQGRSPAREDCYVIPC